MKSKHLVGAVLLLAFGLSVHAQTALVRGKKYVLRAPLTALTFEGSSLWNGAITYAATVEQAGDTATINAASDWLAKGYPDDQQLTLKKTRTDKKSGLYEIELGSDTGNTVKLRFANEQTAATLAPRLLIDASDAAEVKRSRENAYAEIAKSVFGGTLATVPAERQAAILAAVRKVSKQPPTIEKYKDKQYLGVGIGGGDYVYNTLQMNRSERVARRMADVLGSVKALHKDMGGCTDGIDGIKIDGQAAYRNFVASKYGADGVDQIAAYVPCSLIEQFANADITSQALVNGSVILVDGDRVEVTLNQ